MKLSGRSLLSRAKKCRPRPLRVESLELRYMLSITVVDDTIDLRQNGTQVELDVLANDVFGDDYTGAGLITSTSFGSEGGRIAIAQDGQGLLYTAPADFEGTETFAYAIDGRHTGTVRINVRAPLAEDRYEIPPDGLTHELNVMANDPFWDGYDGPRQITAVSVTDGEGHVEIAPGGQSVLYTPATEQTHGESFIYVVDDLYPARVKIDVPATLQNDVYEAVQHDPPRELHVLVNDPFWPGYSGERKITHVTESLTGAEITIAPDGKSLHYAQPESAGGWDTFRYVVDGTYEASVTFYVYRPVRDDWFEVDENSTNFEYNVIQNDDYYDIHGIRHDVIDRVTSVTQSTNGGTVAVSADGRGVVYTPAEGFAGTDAFTYTADGVHEATVNVQVTRPVRDDYIHSGVYQDTPRNVVNVLANDFIGNGYAGAKIITGVGATEEGGEIQIAADGKTIRYTPASGFVGYDRFTYTVDGELEASATIYVAPLAQSDYFQFCARPEHENGPYTLSVLANDHFEQGYLGPGVITDVEVNSGAGTATIVGGSAIQFAPASDGYVTLTYTVDGEYQAHVSISIVGHLNADLFVVDQNSDGESLSVLSNDFQNSHYQICPSSQYAGPRVITAATQSEHGGTVIITGGGKSVEYIPPADFSGRDRFAYTVDGFMTAAVEVEVIRRVRDDTFRVDAADGPQALPVLVNDLLGANYSGTGEITGVTETVAGGSATVGPDGKSIVYTPAEGFAGVDTFTYTVDGMLKAEVRVVVDAPTADQFPTFQSAEEYLQFLIDDAQVRYEYLFGMPNYHYQFELFGDSALPTSNGVGRSHSETNVQVAGVDEGDIVEFDADYVYTLNDDGVVIVDAWPAEEMHVVSRVDIQGQPIAQFLHGDRLTVISQPVVDYYPVSPWETEFLPGGRPAGDAIIGGNWYYPPQPSETYVTVIDISDRAAPTIVQTTEMEGTYVDSRGVGDFVYLLVNNGEAVAPRPQAVDTDDPQAPGGQRYETVEEYIARLTANSGEAIEAALPNYTTYDGDGELVRTGLLNTPETIRQPLVPEAASLISVVSFNVESDEPGLTDTSAIYSTGAGSIYASLDNFYVFDTDYSTEDGAVTRIVKFDWEPATGGVEFAATTTVAGTIINQFSADESGDYLRIATTASNSYSGNWSGRDENLLFVLQEDDGVLEFVGSLQNVALDEDIRSVRFLGDRAFITTFRNVDPLFALDLSDPTDPLAVGHITLPGFTSYMHLVDQNYLLTVGRNTPGGTAGPTQVSLFDITDLTQPLRIAEYTFPRFSTSEAEIDHHAFGYYAEHGLLGMPVATIRYERVDEDGDGYHESRLSVREDLLAVFSVDADASDPNQRLQLATEIAHATPVRRSGYIGDKLFSIAGDSIKVVDVASVETVIAELDISADDSSIEPIEPVDVGQQLSPAGFLVNGVLVSTPPAADPLVAAINEARAVLAAQLGEASGAPLLVTVEATPDAPGDGYAAVFRVDGQHYLVRSGGGHAQLIDPRFQFDAAGEAWNSISLDLSSPDVTLPGDYNLDSRVDELDYQAWKQSFGQWSLTTYLSADGNLDGVVDAADVSVWRDNLGAVAQRPGDYNGDGAVTAADHDFWRAHFGATAGVGLSADGNRNGVVDAGDYSIWRDHLALEAEAAAGSSSATEEAFAGFVRAPFSPLARRSFDLQVEASSEAPPADEVLLLLSATHAEEAADPADDTPQPARGDRPAGRQEWFRELGEEQGSWTMFY